jgi:hypothetical protein
MGMWIHLSGPANTDVMGFRHQFSRRVGGAGVGGAYPTGGWGWGWGGGGGRSRGTSISALVPIGSADTTMGWASTARKTRGPSMSRFMMTGDELDEKDVGELG